MCLTNSQSKFFFYELFSSIIKKNCKMCRICLELVYLTNDILSLNHAA